MTNKAKMTENNNENIYIYCISFKDYLIIIQTDTPACILQVTKARLPMNDIYLY